MHMVNVQGLGNILFCFPVGFSDCCFSVNVMDLNYIYCHVSVCCLAGWRERNSTLSSIEASLKEGFQSSVG